MNKLYSTKMMNKIAKFWLVLLIVIIGASRTNIFAEGTKQLAPSSSDRLYLALCMEEYGNFGQYNGTPEQRLFIHIENPSQEQVFLGFSQFVSSGHYPYNGANIDAYVRIKDPNGRIVWPNKDNVNGKSVGAGNIADYNQAVNGPNQIAPNIFFANDGYDAWVFDPAPYGAGDYYIEFSNASGEYSSNDLFTEWWDITVATKNAHPTAINGRVWSNRWALQSPGDTGFVNGSSQFDSFARAFNGKVYSYCTEPNFPGGYVTEVDFRNSGFRGAAFNLAFNSTGTDNTNDFSINKKSVVNANKLSPEFPIFLNEPEIVSYPSADSYGKFVTDIGFPILFGCEGNYFFRVSVEKKGRIELLLDFDGVEKKYDPNTRDRIITTLFNPYLRETGVLIRDIPWDGKDGKGNVVSNIVPITATFDYCQGTFHFPMYDVEFLETGIVPRTVRPATPTAYTARLYWDDSNIPLELPQDPKAQRKVELTGSAAPNHYWDYYNYSSDYGYGNRNSINTYWNSYQTGTINTFTFDLPAHGCELFVPGSISGTVFNDINRNGVKDEGEGPLTGANVYLYYDVNNSHTLDDDDVLVDTFVTKTPGSFLYPEGTGNFLFIPEQGKEYLVGVSNGTDIVTTSNYRYYTMYSKAEEHFNQFFGLTPAPELNFTLDRNSIGEDNKTATLTANLSYAPIVPVSIRLEYLGTAGIGDYSIVTGINAPEPTFFEMPIGITGASMQYTSVVDMVDENDETIIIQIASMENCVENGDQKKTITILDDDTAGISASITSLFTDETGKEDKFTLVLDSKPTGDVQVSLRSTNLLEGVVNPQIVKFTPENWHIPMEVIVTGQDDAIDDGDVNYVIELFNVISTDSFYDELDPLDINVTNLDDDVAQLVVSKTEIQVSEEASGFESFTVRLATKPTKEIIISISSSDESEGIVSRTSLSFTTSDWDSPQTITVTGVDDAIDDGDQEFFIVLDPSSLDGNYNSLGNSIVTAVNKDDNDTADFIVSAVSGNTNEYGRTATFTVQLQTQPLHDVQIAISSSDVGEGTVAPANLTFTPAKWNEVKVITLTGVNDLIEDGSQPYTITLNPESSDEKYNVLGNKTVSLQNEDDLDKVGVVVGSISGNTKEDGTQASFTLKLNSEPILDVSFSIDSNDEGEGIASPEVYTFNSENWMTARTITVTGINDAVDDGNQNYKIILTAFGTDSKYTSLAPTEVNVVNEDDDTAAYIVSESSIETNESGTSASFTVVLRSQPTHNVIINLNCSDSSEGLLDRETLTFTSDNWDSPKTVVVTGVNDDVDDDDQDYLINLSCTSSDAIYNALANKSVSVTNIDDDQVDLVVTEISNVTTEAGGTASFTLQLKSEPTHSVTINLSSNNLAEGIVSPVSYTFTAANWNSKKTIVVLGVDDDVDDDDQSYKIIAAIVSSDSKYNDLSDKQVLLVNTDNDTADFIISNSVGNTSESGSSHTFSVKLQSKPTQTVNFELNSSDIGEGLVSPASLSFSPDNWTKTETVTITGVDDDIDDGNQIYQVTIDPISSDSKYNALENKELSLTNEDDDTAAYSLTAISGNTHENGRAVSFGISLESQPTQEVTISLSSTNTLEGTVFPAAIVFNSSNWTESKTVSIYGVDDKVQDGNQDYKIKVHLSSEDTKYANLTDKLVDVINEDDDEVGLLISSISRNTTEAGLTAEFTVKLQSQPTHDVSIALNSSDDTEGSISITPITFDASNWNDLKIIVVTGVNDDVNDGDENYQALLKTSSADVLYDAIPEMAVEIINEDDDFAAYEVSAVSGNTTELGGIVTFSIVLKSEPTAEVSFSIGSSDESEGKVAPTSVTFTAANWDQAKDLIITGQNDNVADDNQTYTVSVTPSSADNKYNLLSKAEFSVVNEDDDSVDYIVSNIDGTTGEDGTSASFTVVLNSEPTHDVTIAMGSSDLGEGSLAVDHLLFTSTTWDKPQTVIVLGVDDDVDDDDQNYKINLTTSSSDSKYDFLTGKEVLVINTDNDVVGYQVNELSSITTELGGKATFSVVLNSEPTGNVTISLLSTDKTEGTLSVSNLVFNSANWKDSQEVTVTGVNDNVADGNQTYKIQLSPVSSDGKYNVLPSQEIDMTNEDDDSFGLIASLISGTTDETGKKATFTLKLNSEPTHNVVVSIHSDDTSEGNVSPTELTFTSANWNATQTITVTGVNDEVDDDDQNYFIVLNPSSIDSNYDGLSNQQVAVTNVDDDQAALILTAISNHIDEQGATATFTVRLQTKPVSGVTIDLESLDLGEGTVSPSTLSFDSSDWSSPKTITVTGVNDDEDDDDQAFDINLKLSGSIDLKYKALSDYSMEVVNVDDDGAGITVNPISVSTSESGGLATFTIVLLSQPIAEVRIALSSDNESEGKIDRSDVVFDDGNWNSPVTITVTGQDDQVDDGDREYTIITSPAVSTDKLYGGRDPENVHVVNMDDDQADFILSESSLSVDEVGIKTKNFTVKLASEPVLGVIINLNSNNLAEGVLDKNTLAFDSGNWNAEQTVSLTSVDEKVEDGDQNYKILVNSTSSTDEEYKTLASKEINATTVDNDHAIENLIDENAADNIISENAGVGVDTYIKAQATDQDSDAITYSLTNDADGRFAIDADGVVRVFDATKIDFEKATSHQIEITACSADGSSIKALFIIQITDVDATGGDTDHPIESLIDADLTANVISENAAIDDKVHITAQAYDADKDVITYSLASNFQDWFKIDPESGIVSVSGNIDYESSFLTDHKSKITVLATSTDGSTKVAEFEITITDVDATGGDTDHPIESLIDADLTANAISENAAIDDMVHITALAYDADKDKISYSLTSDFNDWFKIDSESGVVSVNGNIDYESHLLIDHKAKITVLATSTDGSIKEAEFEITITDVDATSGDTDNDIANLHDEDTDENKISENAIADEYVHIKAMAIDADGDIITYSLDKDADGRFKIANDGTVSVLDATKIDYEKATSHNITVRATSADGTFLSKTFTILITDVDGAGGDKDNAVANLIDVDGVANSISENAIDGDLVHIQAYAEDADGDVVSYTLDNNAGGRFEINSATGVVTVMNHILIDFDQWPSHEITVRATSSDASSVVENFTISIEDVLPSEGDTDNDISGLTDSDSNANRISENIKSNEIVHITAHATDIDLDIITYSLDDNAGGRFQIDGSLGIVTVLNANLIDYELNASHKIEVRATSTDGSFSTAEFTILVDDEDAGAGDTDNEIEDLKDIDAADNSISENAIADDVVHIQAQAIDLDEDDISYTLDDNADGRFNINSVTGVVRVLDASKIDYEKGSSHNIVVRATSTDNSSIIKTFTIVIIDEDSSNGDTDNKIANLHDADGLENRISENAGVNDLVHITAKATDADKDEISYSLTEDADGRFQIDPTSGVVTVLDASKIDYEKEISHEITVKASSTDGSSLEQNFTIDITNVGSNDGDTDASIAGLKDIDPLDDVISENAKSGDPVNIQAEANDADNDVIIYSLIDDAEGRFAIDSGTGIVTVFDETKINYEENVSHVIDVRAASSDGSEMTLKFTITVTDVDADGGDTDNGIVNLHDEDGLGNSISENAIAGDLAHITALATDADNDVITYSLTIDADGRFRIDAASGVVTVDDATNIDYETDTSHTITVKASSTDNTSITRDFIILVNDVNANEGDTDNKIANLHDADLVSNTISENAKSNDEVHIKAMAEDADDDVITYSLINDAGGRFQIEASSGIVRVLNADLIDYEQWTTHSIEVLAKSSDGSEITANFTITISNVDGNGGDTDNRISEISDIDLNDNSISENALLGNEVHITAHASDADDDKITYTLTDDADGRFQIDAVSGIVKVANASFIDYENSPSHQIEVMASSSDKSYSLAYFTILITNVDHGEGDTDHKISEIKDVDNAIDNISENALSDDLVGITAEATDEDRDYITYSLTDNAGGRFKIDTNTGVVSVNNADLIDFEQWDKHSITVRALSTDGTNSEKTFIISVTNVDSGAGDTDHAVVDLKDNNVLPNQISENVLINEEVGITALATDSDGDLISYYLIDNAGGRFKIDKETGIVTVADPSLIDFEQSQTHKITIKAVSTDGSAISGEFEIKVEDVDANTGDTDHAITNLIDDNDVPNLISENVVTGDFVFITAKATDEDGDKITYSLTETDENRFKIDETSGVVTVDDASLIDFDKWTLHTIRVKASSTDGSVIEKDFIIEVMDENLNTGDTDNLIKDLTDADENANVITENSEIGSLVHITAIAIDEDGDKITYFLTDNFNDWFQIDKNSGVVSVKGNLDYESVLLTNYEASITILAASTDGSTVEENFVITIENADGILTGGGDTDHLITGKEITDIDTDANMISENALENDLVHLTAFVADEDGDLVTYELTNDFHAWFQIDAATGVVSVKGNIDYDSTDLNEHKATVSVKATSTDLSTTSKDFEIAITEADGNIPGSGDTDHLITGKDIIDTDNGANEINENATVNDIVHLTANVVDEDGDVVTYVLTDDFHGWFQIDASRGIVSVKGNIDYDSAELIAYKAIISVKAISTDLSITSKDFEIGITEADGTIPGGGDTDHAIKDLFDADLEANVIGENIKINELVHISAKATDEDDDKITYSLVDNFNNWFQIDENSGVVSVKGNVDYESDLLTDYKASITVLATSTDGSTVSEKFTISIENAEGDIVGEGDTDHFVSNLIDIDTDANVISENIEVGSIVHITAMATDDDGDRIYYLLTNNFNNRFEIDENTGVVRVKGNIDYESSSLIDHKAKITVLARSSDGSTVLKDFIITVENVDGSHTGEGDTDNEVKELIDVDLDANVISENIEVGGLVHITAMATDADGDKITYSLIDNFNNWFQIDENSGVVSVKSNIDYESSLLVDYKAIITIQASSSDGSSIVEDFIVSIEDADGNAIGGGDSDHAVSSITDTDDTVNEVSENAENDTYVGITALASDSDGDAITYSLSNDADGRFTIDALSGKVTVADETKLDFEQWNSHIIEVQALSTDGSFEVKEFTIQVLNADGNTTGGGDTDHAVADLVDVNENENSIFEHPKAHIAVGIIAKAIDADGDKIFYSLTDDADGRFSIDENSGIVTLVNPSKIDFEQWNSHSIMLRATSSDNSFVEKEFAIQIKQVNDAPSFQMETLVKVKEDEGYSKFESWAKNISSGPKSEFDQKLEFIVKTDRSDLFTEQPTIEPDGSLSFVPAPDVHGIAHVEVVLFDDGGLENGGRNVSESKTFEIEILNINDAPEFTLGENIALEEDEEVPEFKKWATNIKAGPANESSQTVEFHVSNTNNELFSIQPKIDANGNLTFTVVDNSFGEAEIFVKLKDDGGLENGGVDTSSTRSFTITVAMVNDIPIAVSDAFTVEEGGTLNVEKNGVLSNDKDIDNENLLAVLKSDPAHGELSLAADGSFIYIHDGSESTTDEFTYAVSDGTIEGNVVSVFISITPLNDAPNLQDDYAVVDEDNVLKGENLLSNDSDIEMNQIAINTSPFKNVSHGNLKINSDGTYVYTPEKDYFGEDSFVYEAVDNGSPVANATATVFIMVNQVKDAPLATSNVITVLEASQNNSLEIVDPFDPDGDELRVTILKVPVFGTVTQFNTSIVHAGETISVEELKALVYNAPKDYVGQNTFDYVVTDTDGLEARASVVINVVPETVFLPEAFTPNGDSENENFVIVGIENFPTNSIEIFNRWGNMVFTMKNYDNSWNGFGNVKGQLSSGKLPSATYFYILKLGEGKKPITGHIYMMY